jgi:Ca2+-binding RTX toxin-like protein
VAAIIDGTAMSVYINGELVGSGTLYGGQTLDRSFLSTPLSNDRTQNWIGRSAWSDPFADLSVYDARIYNDVRTQAEILQDMQGLTTANDPNLLKRLTLDGTTDGLGGATRTVSLGTLPSANYTDNPNPLVVHVDAQAVSLTGTTSAETLTAAAGNDSVQGLAGNDVLWGIAGNDTLNGGNGNDTMNGQAGYDLLIGGPGSDTMTGELQADTFQWLAGDAFDPSTAAVPVVGGVKTPYTDTVIDFTLQQGDKIDLKGLLADTFQTHGVNASNISANIANYVNLSQSGTSTTALIKVDLDGAGNFVSPELIISLTNAWAGNNLYSTWTLQNLMNSKVLVVL